MRRTVVALSTLALAGAALVAAPAPASAASTSNMLITFTGDTTGSKPNGWFSAESSQVFFASEGSSLTVADYGQQSKGKGLSTSADVAGVLQIQLAAPTIRISVAFGNDDPNFTAPGAKVVMELFRGATPVLTKSVVMNRNDVMDQRITQDAGPVFDRARITYATATGGPLDLIEIVDDIQVNALCSVWGTEGKDTLTGTAGDDVICGGGGNDVIDAQAGNDLVWAGDGNDTVDGGVGLDRLTGGAGDDIVLGKDGADVLIGKEGADRLDGGTGTDNCDGGPGTDTAISCETRTSFP